ncbi:MAG: sodium:proton antiporter, partial [Syntrophomonadaceae bacterium]|nr:sodium:proton antiporter [Syntrophomonadaceae bacterium]
MWLAVLVFLAAYTAIVTDKIHRTVTALLGGCIVVVGGVISQEEAFASIDFNTIGLLIGMMLVVGITRQSGVFEYAGIRAAKLAGGRPASLLVVLSLLTAGASALLDNVTTVLLIVPVTYAIADQLRVSPIPFIFAEILSSNIGGTATLIGDPPNIMIGSAAGLGFVDFLVNLGPPVLVILVFTLALLLVMFRRQLQASPQDIQAVLQMDETQMVKDWALMKKSLLVLALTTVGFFL